MHPPNQPAPPAGAAASAPPSLSSAVRLSVAGKFLFAGNRKFHVKGATYGPFRPEADGSEYHTPDLVERDFAMMAAAGLNAVRTYTCPPAWLLDLALAHGLRVMVGMPWEQHITFLDRRSTVAQIEARIRAAVQSYAGHPAVLCYSIGNEIPASIVRWHGPNAVERLLERFYVAAKEEDPGALVTYVNYPSTEYLALPFLDLLAFNVYLESPDTLSAYLARLQNIAGDQPLLMAEVGLDSLRHGEERQAEVLAWQIRTAFTEAAAGLFVFSWTDEWFRGGHEIEDWNFGLITRQRRPKPALKAVKDAFHAVPPLVTAEWPLVSVVICSYNGARTLRQALDAVARLNYPRFEVLVVDDGSTDATPSIAREFGVRLISIPNGGLSNARNVGWRNAKGKIVAYLDDDACPDPQWLAFLASSLLRGDSAGVCGPNLSPLDDPFIARCVDHSPGNPTHVLIDDQRAEHIPGCNMAFWRDRIEAVGGFDATFRIAGDDVDFCWRLQEKGWGLGFSAGAVVWHHRRSTVKTYWKQQMNYGRAEAMLERKWPAKYNAAGHLSWSGRVYTKAVVGFALSGRQRVYHGTWGTALFQSVYSLAPGAWSSLLALPEWYLIVALFGIASVLGLFFHPLQWAAVGFALTFGASVVQAALTVRGIRLQTTETTRFRQLQQRLVVTGLHLLQPAARLWGRLSYGLTPWRRRGRMPFMLPGRRLMAWWDEQWRSSEERLGSLEKSLQEAGAIVARGGVFDRWDLEVRSGLLGAARILMTIEEHGAGRQLVRLKVWPSALQHVLRIVLMTVVALSAVLLDLSHWLLLTLPAALLLGRVLYEFGAVMGAVSEAFISPAEPPAGGVRAVASLRQGATAGDPHTPVAGGTAVTLESAPAASGPIPVAVPRTRDAALVAIRAGRTRE